MAHSRGPSVLPRVPGPRQEAKNELLPRIAAGLKMRARAHLPLLRTRPTVLFQSGRHSASEAALCGLTHVAPERRAANQPREHAPTVCAAKPGQRREPTPRCRVSKARKGCDTGQMRCATQCQVRKSPAGPLPDTEWI